MASLVHKLSIENVTNGSCFILDNCKWQFDFVNAHVIFGVKKYIYTCTLHYFKACDNFL